MTSSERGLVEWLPYLEDWMEAISIFEPDISEGSELKRAADELPDNGGFSVWLIPAILVGVLSYFGYVLYRVIFDG